MGTTLSFQPQDCVNVGHRVFLRYGIYIYMHITNQSSKPWSWHLKGSVTWEIFCTLDPFYEDDLRSEIFWFWWRRDKLNFISICVYPLYDKIFLAYSPNTFIFITCILCTRLNTSGVFGDYFCSSNLEIWISRIYYYNFIILFGNMLFSMLRSDVLLWKYWVERSEACLNLFWKYINRKLFSVRPVYWW